MEPNYTQVTIIEIIVILNYIISIFIAQIGLIFTHQSYKEREKKIKSEISTSYGLFYIFLAFGILINIIITYHEFSIQLYDLLYLLSIIFRGLGIGIFLATLEYNIQKVIKSRYLLSVALYILLISISILYYSMYFEILLNLLNIIQVVLPIIFTIYVIRNTYGKIRKKSQITFLGTIILFVGLFINTRSFLERIQIIYIDLTWFLFYSNIIVFIGIFLLIYSFSGYSFMIEIRWRKNLISIHIIDKDRHKSLYFKNFIEAEVKSQDLFAGGISGLDNLIKRFTDADKSIDIINYKDKKIILDYGVKIISAMIIKRNPQNLRYILNEITKKSESYFWEYLEYYDRYETLLNKSEFLKPLDNMVDEIIKI